MSNILIVDSIGQPVRWAAATRAAHYYAVGKVIADLGQHHFSLSGGFNRLLAKPSEITCSSIVMVRGKHRLVAQRNFVGLSRERLFLRDRYLCAYCGQLFNELHLTIEHVIPVSRGGTHGWTNVVTACRGCNHRKGNRTPEEARMPLIYVPYAVCRNEGFIISNRNILGDQMEFLASALPRHSRWAKC